MNKTTSLFVAKENQTVPQVAVDKHDLQEKILSHTTPRPRQKLLVEQRWIIAAAETAA